MTRRIAKIAALSVLSCIVAGIILAAALFWRLSQGPVSLASVSPRVEASINSQLTGMSVKLGAMVLELEPDTLVPKLRFRNMTLVDQDGKLIASAPKAAVTLDSGKLLRGEIVPVDIELIGPSLRAQRNLNGQFELGVVGEALSENETVDVGDLGGAPGAGDVKSDLGGGDIASVESPDVVPRLLEMLASKNGGGSLSTIQEIRVSRARVA